MSFDTDDEILQDFLIEAGEILELLSEQLVELENSPEDRNLLNAIFRGFHTVKGGAGFLQLDPLVEVCHVAENVFDMLRNGKLQVSSALMDVILQALDAVNEMFARVSQREMPKAASPALLAALHRIAEGGEAQAATPAVKAAPPVAKAATPASVKAAPAEEVGYSEAELANLMSGLMAEPAPVAPASDVFGQFNEVVAAAQSGGDEITEDEFEAMLDQLHGKGKAPVLPAAPALAATPVSVAAAVKPVNEFESAVRMEKELDGVPGAATSGDLISEAEFEALLDQLHGKGQAPALSVVAPVAMPAPVEAAAPRPAAPKPAREEEGGRERPAPAAAAPTPEAAGGAETTVRVDTKRLDDIMNMVGELVLVRNRLVRLGLNNSDEEMSKAVANLDVVTADLQMAVMKTRMQPIKKVFGRFPRVVRDLARNLKKEVELELIGEDTDLDKNLVEALADPLVHLVRNAVDHGIEMPSVREQRGKPRLGRIMLSAEQEGDHIVLAIKDDGGGMDANVLRGKAVEKGLLDEDTAARLSEQECFNLIFHPGFSTKDQISDISGRGVGMDVVKTKIAQLNGSIDIRSEKDQGTVIAIKVPLTLAIMPTLMVMLGNQAFALPLVSVNEIFHLDMSRKNIVDGQDVVIVREKALPLFYLKRWLVRGAERHVEIDEAHVVIVTVGTKKVGFVVDQLIGQEEVVIKPLGSMLQGTPGMAGATITGDGRIALILDVPSMLKHYAHRMAG